MVLLVEQQIFYVEEFLYAKVDVVHNRTTPTLRNWSGLLLLSWGGETDTVNISPYGPLAYAIVRGKPLVPGCSLNITSSYIPRVFTGTRDPVDGEREARSVLQAAPMELRSNCCW